MQKRKRSNKFESSSVIDSATNELTKMTVVVTVVFFFCMGYDLW